MTSFRDLHHQDTPMILANAWDIGSARMLAANGAQALATSSAAYAFTLGLPDGTLDRDQHLAHAQDIVAATPLPVQGDFENGFGDDPETCSETVRLAAEIGLAGICIEDTILDAPAQANGRKPAYDFDLAVERIAAACAAARALPNDFVLTARADGMLTGTYDTDEALRRIQAFDAAGADCLYAPLPPSWDDLVRLVNATDKPTNALIAGPMFVAKTQADYAAIGVARLSLGSSLARITHAAIQDAATAMFGAGDFTPVGNAMSGDKVDALLTKF